MIDSIDLKIAEAQEELKCLREERMAIADGRKLLQFELQNEHFEACRRFNKFQQMERLHLHTYLHAVQEVRAEDHVPRDIIQLEGQLCQSMHRMYVNEQQLRIAKNASKEILAWYHLASEKVLRGKQDAEKCLMKRIVELDEETKAIRETNEERVEAQRDIIERTKRVLIERGITDFDEERGETEDDREENRDDGGLGSFLRRIPMKKLSIGPSTTTDGAQCRSDSPSNRLKLAVSKFMLIQTPSMRWIPTGQAA